ncbi:integrase core domain-containing [Paramuricea clavata]|uniref:Integrase core domain-containing n=1 Tax=Paramuricea clavata TaxID=317549 RepID=A0A6S7HUM0_PARCT|nr:integrase core domain-containing [Paramuricea clavata]
MDTLDLGLRELYFNVNGGYMSMEKLYRNAVKKDIPGVTREKVKAWLQTQNTYIVHKPTRVHFKTQRTYVDGLAQQLQLDLVDMQKYSHVNKGYKWILTSIEILSRYAFVVPAYRKGTKDMVPAVEKILEQFHERFGRYPKVVQFDEGKEFYNNGVKGLLEKHDIHYFSTRLTGKKAAIVERFNRTLKTRMWKYFTEQQFTTKSKKWINVLDNFVASYNHSKHRTIDMKPADVNETNKDKVWTKLYGYPLSHFPEPKFKVGDRVRDQIYRNTFVKGYTSNYTDDVYVVSEVFRGDPNMYKLINPDDDDREIQGRFYEHELSLDLSGK